jgi:hypothetical protein
VQRTLLSKEDNNQFIVAIGVQSGKYHENLSSEDCDKSPFSREGSNSSIIGYQWRAGEGDTQT